jgi:single-stranded DNA-specific DHH superfamily exonuclease
MIGPRLNSSGRLGEAQDALQLLLSEESEAVPAARKLNELNKSRQDWKPS